MNIRTGEVRRVRWTIVCVTILNAQLSLESSVHLEPTYWSNLTLWQKHFVRRGWFCFRTCISQVTQKTPFFFIINSNIYGIFTKCPDVFHFENKSLFVDQIRKEFMHFCLVTLGMPISDIRKVGSNLTISYPVKTHSHINILPEYRMPQYSESATCATVTQYTPKFKQYF